MILDKPGIIWKPVVDKVTGAPLLDMDANPVFKDASHIDQKGHMHSASASMITTFDKRTPFGCPSKHWFGEVAAQAFSGNEATELGDQCHKEVEHYLIHKQDAFGKIVRPGKPMIDALIAKYPVYQVEQWLPFGFKIDGINIRGRLDFIGRRLGDGLIANITDWKTTSNFDMYAKTPYQLRKDAQMLIYRAGAEQMGCDEKLDMNHGYFQTKGARRAEMVNTSINREQLSEGLDDIHKTLRAMQSVSAILDSDAVEKDLRKCDIGKGGCPYKSQCLSHKENTTMASLFSKFRSAAPVPASIPERGPAFTPARDLFPEPPITAPSTRKLVIQDVPTEVSAVVDPMVEALKAQISALEAKKAAVSVLPPDAPKSDPAKAALPVEGFSPIPASLKDKPPAPPEQHNTAKKGGRPPGSKNKPKEEHEETTETVEVSDYEILEMGLTHGLTLKAKDDPKCFEFIRADVTLKARVRPGADVEKVRAALSVKARDAVLAEISVYKDE